jgi:hypothetical protein
MISALNSSDSQNKTALAKSALATQASSSKTTSASGAASSALTATAAKPPSIAASTTGAGQTDKLEGILRTFAKMIELIASLLSAIKGLQGKDVTASGSTKPASTASTLKSGGQFLWKPESDKDKKLAVLLPSNLQGKVKDVTVVSPDGSRTLAKGTYSGVGNGDREHYRFSKPGGEYPDGSILLVKMRDGTSQKVTIKETSRRLEK